MHLELINAMCCFLSILSQVTVGSGSVCQKQVSVSCSNPIYLLIHITLPLASDVGHVGLVIEGVLPNFEGAIFIIPFHIDNHKTPIKSIQMKNFN